MRQEALKRQKEQTVRSEALERESEREGGGREMDLAHGRNLGGMSTMDEMLRMPFDQLWTSSSGHVQQPIRSGMISRPAPEINYEAVLALGGSSMVNRGMPVASMDGGQYQDLAQLDDNCIRRGVKRAVLQAIPNHFVAPDQQQQCQICMESFNGRMCAKALPCGHVFCKKCIFQWLSDHDTCPTCRWKFPENQTQLVNLRAQRAR